YTTIEGERCIAARGDLILTPNGTWHDHGNDGASPVVWADILDFPLLEFLDCSWIDEDFPGEREGNARAQKPVYGAGYSERLYGAGGILPGFVSHRRGIGHDTSPVFHYRGTELRPALVRKDWPVPRPGPHPGRRCRSVDYVTRRAETTA